MTTAVTAFVCDFCTRKKRFATKLGAARHEAMCFHNPARRACITCKHLTLEKYHRDEETGYSDGGPYCEFELIPIPETPEQPGRQFTFDCEKWESL